MYQYKLNITAFIFIDIGNVYISDLVNQRIRKFTSSTGVISTIAGTGSADYSGDNGAATSAALANPYGIALDSSENVYYVAQSDIAGAIRKIDISTNIITTVAGGYGWGYSGDNVAASSAPLCNPVGIAVDVSGISIFIC